MSFSPWPDNRNVERLRQEFLAESFDGLDRMDRCLPELGRRLDSVTADLRETVMQARMQPVGHLFGRFPRVVRELAASCGKRVRMELAGQETGLNKSLFETIKDPLMRAIRNAVDHGIEPAEARLAAGKPEEGTICLRACHRRGWVVLNDAMQWDGDMQWNGDAEQFGLMVDSVGGVVPVGEDLLAGNPPPLEQALRRVFEAAYRAGSGLIVQFDPDRMRPQRLMLQQAGSHKAG